MEITKELEALAKYQNSGAPIIFADCQIVFGDNATLFGDILKKDTAHASTTQDPQGVDPKFKTEKAKTIFKKLVENGYTIQKALLTCGMYLRLSMVIWSISFLTF